MWWIIIIGIAVVIIARLASVSNGIKKELDIVDKYKDMRTFTPEQAVEFYSAWIELKPNDYRQYQYRADAKFKLGDYLGTLEDLAYALNLGGTEEEVLLLLKAISLSRLHHYDDALAVFNSIDDALMVSKDSGAFWDVFDAEYSYELGFVKENLFDAEGALDNYISAMYRDPSYAKKCSGDREVKDLYALCCNFQAVKDWSLKRLESHAKNELLFKEADTEEGLFRQRCESGLYTSPYLYGYTPNEQYENLTKKIENNNPNYDWFIRRGEALFLLGRYTEALADFDQAYQLYPYYCWDYGIPTCRGAVKLRLGDYQGAVEDFTLAYEQHHHYTSGSDNIWKYPCALLLYGRGYAKRQLQQYDSMIEDYLAAIHDRHKEDYSYVAEIRNTLDEFVVSFPEHEYVKLYKQVLEQSIDKPSQKDLQELYYAVFLIEGIADYQELQKKIIF